MNIITYTIHFLLYVGKGMYLYEIHRHKAKPKHVYVCVRVSESVSGCGAWTQRGAISRRRQNLWEGRWKAPPPHRVPCIPCADDVSNWRESSTPGSSGSWQVATTPSTTPPNRQGVRQIQVACTRLYRWLVSEVWILGIYLISSCACDSPCELVELWKSRKPICLAQITAQEEEEQVE